MSEEGKAEAAAATPEDVNVDVEVTPQEANIEVEIPAPKEPEPELLPEECRPVGDDPIGSGDKRLVIDINEPRFCPKSLIGKFRNYFGVRNPGYLFASDGKLKEARETVKRYLSGADMDDVTVDQLRGAKEMFDSTYHPDTGEKVTTYARKAAAVPMDGTITGLLMTFYRSLPGIVFWQWAKQTYDSSVEYHNRPMEGTELKPVHYTISYMLATSAAIMTAVGLGSMIKKKTPRVVGRLVPFAGVAAATCVAVPYLKVLSLYEGIPVYDKDNNILGNSGRAAARNITCTTVGTIAMLAPPMALTPIMMDRLEKNQFFCRYPWAHAPMQIALVAFCIMFITPMVYALLPNRCSISFDKLERGLQSQIKKDNDSPPDVVYYKSTF